MMANLVENPNYELGIYQLEMTDPVLGGPPDLAQALGLSNVAAQQLANRTAWLKAQIDLIVAGYATTDDLATAINDLIGGAPAALDTLNELASALADDEDFAATVTAQLTGKMSADNNLSELTDTDVARTNLGVELPIGVGQTLQDVTGSRSSGTVYQNTSGRTIFAIIDISGSTGNAQLSPDGVSFTSMVVLSNHGTTLLVPDGWYYKTSGTLQRWVEIS